MASDRLNVTLSLPRDVVVRLRHEAADRGTSLSGLILQLVESTLTADQAYPEAMERQIRLMRKGLKLGLGERPGCTRDELHER